MVKMHDFKSSPAFVLFLIWANQTQFTSFLEIVGVEIFFEYHVVGKAWWSVQYILNGKQFDKYSGF